MKKKICSNLFICLVYVLSPLLILFSFDLAVEGEYDEFYYAELGNMYDRLKTTEGKKIVIIGNSNISFGVESRYFEELISDFESEYSVVNFGLYGSIGTKTMLDLAQNYIYKDDIVILVPEEYGQSMSLFFSAKELWYSLDSNRAMFHDLDSRSKEALVGNYIDYVSKKYKFSKNENKTNLGIYTASSFDEHCDMTNCSRDYNIMYNDYDENNLIDLTTIPMDESFISYVNEYNDTLVKKGAKMYYSFAPMNCEAIVNSQTEIDGFYNSLREKLNFPIISDINTYIMEKEWFYDSNYHLNMSGMKLRTYLLVEDLKNELGITTKTSFPMVDKPVKPDSSIEGEGDNSCSDCFLYERDGSYYKIVGLTEKGKTMEELVIPYQVDGLYISEFTKDVFQCHRAVKKITIQKNIKRIYDNSFLGCDVLEGIYLEHESPSLISVGFNLLVGTPGNIYVYEEVKTSFIGDYFWGQYQERIVGYEKD